MKLSINTGEACTLRAHSLLHSFRVIHTPFTLSSSSPESLIPLQSCCKGVHLRIPFSIHVQRNLCVQHPRGFIHQYLPSPFHYPTSIYYNVYLPSISFISIIRLHCIPSSISTLPKYNQICQHIGTPLTSISDFNTPSQAFLTTSIHHHVFQLS